MHKLAIAVLLLIFSHGAIASAPLRPWCGHSFREATSLSAIPLRIREQLHVNAPGLAGVADKGKPFNDSDVGPDSLPMRRLLGVGQAGNSWLVALEHGGDGYKIDVYLFSGNVQRHRWFLPSRPTTLQAVLQQVPCWSGG